MDRLSPSRLTASRWVRATHEPSSRCSPIRGADALTSVVLSIVDTGGVVVNPDQPTAPETVVAGATLAHTYTLKMPANGLGETAVIVRADFMIVSPPSGASPAPPGSPAATAAPPVPGVLTASLAVKPAALGVSAAVAAASGSVSQVNPGTVNVTVTNSGARSFDATVKPRALSAGDSSVTYSPETQFLSAIAPGDSAVATFTVTPGNAIHPGELLLVFDVTAEGADGHRAIVASGTLTLSVFGETEFSGPLGVPTFYVVPGVIMLVAWSLFGGWFGPLSTRTLPSADGKAFWVLADRVVIADGPGPVSAGDRASGGGPDHRLLAT